MADRLVTVLVPTAAGDNTDLMARLGADFLSRKTGKSFVVENKPSAGGINHRDAGRQRGA